MESVTKQGRAPLVSVIMPAYRAERFIEEAIGSVQAQTVTDWELIVIDDVSDDRTADVVRRMAREDARIRFVLNERNMGTARTRNLGFDLCRGEYIALLDSDDVWHPRKLERQLELARQTGADIIYCSYAMVDEWGEKLCDDFIVPEATDLDASLVSSVISCSTALISGEIGRKYRFETDFYHEDLALWLRLLQDGYTARGVTEVLAKYRVMEGSRASNKLHAAIGRWKVYRGYLRLPVVKSTFLLAQYALLGLKKYRRVRV